MEEDLEASMALLDLVASEDLVAFMAVPGLALLALALLDLEASMAVLAGSTTATVLGVLALLALALLALALLVLEDSVDLEDSMALLALALLALALLDLEASMAVLAGSTTTTVLEVLADLAVALAVALVVDSTVVTTDLVAFTATVSTDRAFNQLSDLFRSSF